MTNKIKLYEIEWLLNRNLLELNKLIYDHKLPLQLDPCIDIHGDVVCYMLVDTRDGETFDLYFGNFGTGHFNLPLTQIIKV